MQYFVYLGKVLHGDLGTSFGMYPRSVSSILAIPGASPNLKNVPEGCRFADRCKWVTDICRKGKVENNISSDRVYRCLYDTNKLKELYKNEQK